MKLKHIHIAGYKNLIDTELDFNAAEFPITIIGNNGTGKSNLIEALLHIFFGLYYGTPLEFDFDIQYQAHGKEIEARYSRSNGSYLLQVDGRYWEINRFKRHIRFSEQMPPFPAQVFTYYSGTCDRVASIIKRYNRSYLQRLRTQSENLERQFVFSDITQAERILLGLVAHRHNEVLDELGIDSLGDIRLTFQSPEEYQLDAGEDPTYWGLQGAFREFMAEIDNKAIDRYEPYKYQNKRANRETRTYCLEPRRLKEIGFSLEKRRGNVYSLLQALAARNILISSEFDVVRKDGQTRFRTEYLSEGEKQLLCVIGGLTLAQNEECLVLLDEPDNHLNPAWIWRYHRLLKQALTTQQSATSTTVIATHNPIMISGLTREQVLIVRNDNNRLFYERPHRDPRGQGVANILVSEFFGLPSSLDEYTQGKLDERLQLAYKNQRLTEEERVRLKTINDYLENLGLTISFRDPEYKVFEEERYGRKSQEGL